MPDASQRALRGASPCAKQVSAILGSRVSADGGGLTDDLNGYWPKPQGFWFAAVYSKPFFDTATLPQNHKDHNVMIHLHMAMRFHAERGDTPPGAAMAALRERIAAETDDGRLAPARHMLVADEARRLMAIGIDDMPPATDDVALLLDAIVFAIGATARADAWRSIGINPDRGRDLLARNAQAVDWPIFFTMRCAALG